MNMHTNALSTLLKIETCGEDEITIKLGFLTLARIVEHGDLWYLESDNKIGPNSSCGFTTKELAFEQVVAWYSDDEDPLTSSFD